MIEHKIINAIESIEPYYESVSEFINNPSIKTQVQELMENINSLKHKFTNNLGLDKLSDYFEFIHNYVILCYYLNKLYDLIDFKDIKNSDISNTKSIRIGEMFSKITTIYKTYIKDITLNTQAYVDKYFDILKTSDNPIELNALWRKYPQSILLYQRLIQHLLDQSYKQRDFDKATQIMNIVNLDKNFILEQTEYINALLTFNLVPADDLKLISATELKKFEEHGGIIIIKRHQTNNNLYSLPNFDCLDSCGLSEDACKFRQIYPITGTKSLVWDWSIKFIGTDASQFLIVEDVADNKYRILTQNKFQHSGPGWLPKNNEIISSILNKSYGRPMAYYNIVDQNGLINMYDDRVANLVLEESNEPQINDIGLNVMALTDIAIKKYEKSKKYIDPKDGEIYQDFEKHILDTLIKGTFDNYNPCPMDLLFLWIEKSKKELAKELDHVENSVKLHDILAKLLKKNNNIFQELIQKAYKLHTINLHSL